MQAAKAEAKERLQAKQEGESRLASEAGSFRAKLASKLPPGGALS